MSAGLLGLVGSVGIFVSLIVQRRVQRLQEILEQLVDSLLEEKNLTAGIYRLIEKYQMQYILPDTPGNSIMRYVDLTLALVWLIWLVLFFLKWEEPFRAESLFYLIPLVLAGLILVLFRRLLENAVNPLKNQLFNDILPPPTSLRSVSFLAGYVNVSVKSILRQVRLTVVIRDLSTDERPDVAEIVLKEELSFDDFFYYLCLTADSEIYLVSFGQVTFNFLPDPVTKKPVPVQRNLNIPLGEVAFSGLPELIAADLLVFAAGEKNPVHYKLNLKRSRSYYAPLDDPLVKEEKDVVYEWGRARITILENHSTITCLDEYAGDLQLAGKRWYIPGGRGALREAQSEVYVN